MVKNYLSVFSIVIAGFLLMVSCNLQRGAENSAEPTEFMTGASTTGAPLMPTSVAKESLTICMGSEPASLFLYGDSSTAARNIREAIYDGPFDAVQFVHQPVVLERVPTRANGDVVVEPITVAAGNMIADVNGNPIILGEGAVYYPSGCNQPACAQTFTGSDPVSMDQILVRFLFRLGLSWSDGTPMTANDSQYSYEIASSMYPKIRADVIGNTQSYTTLDDLTIEWRGLPGYRISDYTNAFFSPLPRHAWSNIPVNELSNQETINRKPLGWGAYVVEEWIPGSHISMNRNPNYFRAGEGLPHFEKLNFKFMNGFEAALAGLYAGECDILDETSLSSLPISDIMSLRDSGQAKITSIQGRAWEHADFGINSLDAALAPLFQKKETRQAIVMCTQRQRVVDEIFAGQTMVPDTYTHPSHPLFNPNVRKFDFNPDAAKALLDSIGWVDHDGDPATPRQSQGIVEVTDGTPLSFNYLTTDEADKIRTAEIIKESLANCGVQVNITPVSVEGLLAAGPEGALFGRRFQMAQFNWAMPINPACLLYLSSEIPGPYPDYSKSWSGANVSGFNNPEYDAACWMALLADAEAPEFAQAHFQAQSIFSEEIPSIPLYLVPDWIVTRNDLCGMEVDPSSKTSFWNIENFAIDEACSNP